MGNCMNGVEVSAEKPLTDKSICGSCRLSSVWIATADSGKALEGVSFGHLTSV